MDRENITTLAVVEDLFEKCLAIIVRFMMMVCKSTVAMCVNCHTLNDSEGRRTDAFRLGDSRLGDQVCAL